MKMKLTKLFIGSLIALVVSAHTSFAQTGQMGMMGENESGHGERPAHGATTPLHGRYLSAEALRKELGLSEDQALKMRQLRMQYKKEAIRKSADIQIARLELREELAQKNVGLPQIEKKVQELTTLRGDFMLLRMRNMMKAKEFLNDEQFGKYKRLLLTHASHHWRTDGRGKGMPPGKMMGMRHREGDYGSNEGEGDRHDAP